MMKTKQGRRLVPRLQSFLLLCILVVVGYYANGSEHFDPVKRVDPFIGVDRAGDVLPGACLPFSMVNLGPDTTKPWPSGYRSGEPVLGFSHNHLSGTGGYGRYCNIRVMAQTGPLDVTSFSSLVTDEYAEPGYYSAMLERNGVKAELTLSERCGVHRYTFPPTDTARILIDVSSTWRLSPGRGTRCLASAGRVVSDHEVEGWSRCAGGWGNYADHTTYFAARFDRTFAAFGTWQDETATPGDKATEGTNGGVYVEFKLPEGGTVGLRVGISYISIENARKNLAQTDNQTFEQVRAGAQTKWRDFLGKIEVKGGTEEQRTLFYTSLYRTVAMPTDVTGENPRWQSDEPHFWNFYTFWDTFHCNNSLYALIIPDRETDIIRCLLDIYKHRGRLPDAWIDGDYAAVQGGIDSSIAIADAVVKGLQGFDVNLAYEAMKKDATEPSTNYMRFGRAGEYFTRGYLACDSITNVNEVQVPTSRTLEYAMNDSATAQVAKALGKTNDAEEFTRRSLNGFNLFNPQTKFFWAKDREGQWLEGFNPRFMTRSGYGAFYEGTPWQYACYVPHDVQGLINRHGGNEQFIAFLDQFFDGHFYTQDNEPDLLCPWLYTYAGRPDKSVDRVHTILSDSYHARRTGWPGNDDAGTMSAWYVFGAMGFFPNAGQDVYLMSSPLFSDITIHMGNGEDFKIVAQNLSPSNRYIQSATLNGKPWNKGWFRHGDITRGAELILDMGPKPSAWGTKAEPPPSVSPPE